jgi:hypothetical protein
MKMPSESIQLTGRRLIKTDQTIGPRHDPYGRTTLTMKDHEGNITWELILCGLAGCIFKTKDMVISDFAGGHLFNAVVESITGYDPRFWDYKIWEYQDRAMYRRLGSEVYEQVQQCIEADQRLLRYAM